MLHPSRYCQIDNGCGKLSYHEHPKFRLSCGYRFPPEIISYAVWLYHHGTPLPPELGDLGELGEGIALVL